MGGDRIFFEGMSRKHKFEKHHMNSYFDKTSITVIFIIATMIFQEIKKKIDLWDLIIELEIQFSMVLKSNMASIEELKNGYRNVKM